MADRTYRVLTEDPTADSAERSVYHDLGVYAGHDAEAAVAAALTEHGLDEGVKLAIAVPENNWGECDVKPDPRPQFKITRRAKVTNSTPDGE